MSWPSPLLLLLLALDSRSLAPQLAQGCATVELTDSNHTPLSCSAVRMDRKGEGREEERTGIDQEDVRPKRTAERGEQCCGEEKESEAGRMDKSE